VSRPYALARPRRLIWVLLFVVVPLLYACTSAPRLFVINGTVREIEIVDVIAIRDLSRPEVMQSWGRWLPRPFLIEPGEGRELSWTNFDSHWIVKTKIGNCRATFDVPQTAMGTYYGNSWRPYWRVSDVYELAVQLELDNTLSLVPSDTHGRIELSAFHSIQPAGFPLHPAQLHCS